MGVGAGPGVSQQALVQVFLAEKPLLRRFWPGFLRILEFLEKTPQKRNSATRYRYSSTTAVVQPCIAVNLQRYRGLVNIQFSKILELISRPEFARDHESGLRSDRGPVVLRDFSKLQFWKSPYDFLNLYGRFCPYNPPYIPREKISTRPFSRRSETRSARSDTRSARSQTRSGILVKFSSH